MRSIKNPEVKAVFDRQSPAMRKQLLLVRSLIFKVAAQDVSIGELEECVKWGEPSYIAKAGSTLRINAKTPDSYAVYFNCKTRLIETIKEIYGDQFCYESNRALLFSLDAPLPSAALEHCISLSLRYHRIKHLPLLGA